VAPLDGRCLLPTTAFPAFDSRVEEACRRAAEALRRELRRVMLADLLTRAG
jgi:hypothetical protein